MSGASSRRSRPRRARGRDGSGAAARRRLVLITLLVAVIVALFVFGYVQQESKRSQDAADDPFRLAAQPAMGAVDAPVTVVEFGDFKCPYCAHFTREVFPALKREYIDTGKVRFYFINLAFIGPDSTTAAAVGEAIFAQDPAAFWKFYEAVYERQGPEDEIWATREFLLELAREVAPELDHEALAAAVDDPAYRRRVEDDAAVARRLGVRTVPALFVNGERVTDWSLDSLRRAIDQALAAAEGE